MKLEFRLILTAYTTGTMPLGVSIQSCKRKPQNIFKGGTNSHKTLVVDKQFNILLSYTSHTHAIIELYYGVVISCLHYLPLAYRSFCNKVIEFTEKLPQKWLVLKWPSDVWQNLKHISRYTVCLTCDFKRRTGKGSLHVEPIRAGRTIETGREENSSCIRYSANALV